MENTTEGGAASPELDLLLALQDRLDRIDGQLTPLVQALDALPAGLAVGVDVVDEWAAQAPDRSERVAACARLLLKLTEPEVLAALTQLVAALPEVPKVGATLVDALDRAALTPTPDGTTLDNMVRGVGQCLVGLSRLCAAPQLQQQLAPEKMAARAQVFARLLQALDAAQVRPSPMGLRGLWQAVRDPALQSSFGMLGAMVRAFGNQDTTRRRLDDGKR